LDVNGTQVTDKGVEQLQRALPKCRIEPGWVCLDASIGF